MTTGELDKFTAAQTMARKRGFVVHKPTMRTMANAIR
jgi:hypothetical protein